MQLKTLENGLQVLIPCWDVPSHIHAFVSTRTGGFSTQPFDSLNLGQHVGDLAENVQKNRHLVRQLLPSDPIWLHQVHGSEVNTGPASTDVADGIVTSNAQRVLTIMTADCMPILLCDEQGDMIGACHGGWRGLSSGIIQNTVQEIVKKKGADHSESYRSQLKVYLGPTIGPTYFEVGIDVYQAFAVFLSTYQMQQSFSPSKQKGKYFANLFLLARYILQGMGISQIYSEAICCYENRDLFFSHRRDRQSGRFASFLWKDLI
jgi:polyphenol oxidase